MIKKPTEYQQRSIIDSIYKIGRSDPNITSFDISGLAIEDLDFDKLCTAITEGNKLENVNLNNSGLNYERLEKFMMSLSLSKSVKTVNIGYNQNLFPIVERNYTERFKTDLFNCLKQYPTCESLEIINIMGINGEMKNIEITGQYLKNLRKKDAKEIEESAGEAETKLFGDFEMTEYKKMESEGEKESIQSDESGESNQSEAKSSSTYKGNLKTKKALK